MNYLIFRNDGIGDLILSSPLITAIREFDPKSKIHVISSVRNDNFAKILLKDGFIDEIHLLHTKRDSGKSNYFDLRRKLSKIIYENAFLLKGSTSNLLFTKMLNVRNIFSIVSINKGKIFKDKYSPPLLLLKMFSIGAEFIDCRNDYKNSNHIHMSTHYLNLMISNYDKKNNSFQNQYYVPKYLHRYAESYFKTIYTKYDFEKNKRIILFHFDEKWNLYNHSFIEIKNFILNLHNNGCALIITNGIIENKYESQLKEEFNFQNTDIDENVHISSKHKNILFLDNLNLEKLFSIVKYSNLVITPHGSLTHIASLYDKNLIDLIPSKRINFYSKWQSPNKNSTQFEIKDLKGITEIASKYLKA